MHINDLLKIATERRASDLHLKVGSHPVIRVSGRLMPLSEMTRLTQEDTIAMAFSIAALRAEGIPCSSGYLPLNQEPFLRESLLSRSFLAVHPRDRVDRYFKDNSCPENDRLCQEAVWLFQTMLLGTRNDMDQIADAIRKLQHHANELAKGRV